MNYFKIFAQSFKRFALGKPLRYSSSVAFYLILSLPAILMIVISIAGSVFDDALVSESLINEIGNMFGAESAGTISRILQNYDIGNRAFLGEALSIAVLVFSSTTVITSLQEGINHVWGVKPKARKGFLRFLWSKFLSIVLIIGLGLLLIATLGLDAYVSVFNEIAVISSKNAPFPIIKAMNISASFLITTVIIAVIFKVLPEVHLKWRDMWVGAFITSLLFTAGKYLIGIYLTGSSMGTTYGAAGSLVLFLIWVYYSSVILFFGAHFTFVYIMAKGRNVKPYKRVTVVKEVEVEGYDELFDEDMLGI